MGQESCEQWPYNQHAHSHHSPVGVVSGQVLDAYHKYQRPFMESHWARDPLSAAVSRL